MEESESLAERKIAVDSPRGMARRTKGYDNNYRGYSYLHFLKYLRKKKDRSETLSAEFLDQLYKSQNGLCAITKIPMTHSVGCGFVSTNISIDKISSTGSYTEGNVQLVCYRVNLMKSTGSLSDLKEWCSLILQNEGSE